MSECTALLGQRLGFGWFRTVASAVFWHQPTSCGLSISIINVHKFGNLIGTECGLNRSECRVQNEAS